MSTSGRTGDRATRHPTIGLVTAMPEEFVAMRALLDDTVERYVAGDPAFYVLGTLPSRDADQPHDLVLTLLGATATNAAASGCANLIRSFASITMVVMVGTAAGVPNPHRPERHVRLGDIVVASQGVVDYDHIRAVEGGTQPRRPFPVPSPRLAQCADMLKADEISGHRAWEQWLDPSRRPELRGYGRPPERTDVLHDSAGWPLRHPRRDHSGHRKGLPKVHYGLIGSADRSLSDIATRDQLAARHGFLAVEMEGAGIGIGSFLQGREWFVVRGISDYGDPHRDETWRRYASLAAAAYVRALLARCLPLDPRSTPSPLAVDSLR
jgi:nucleoside phosphorylase